VVWSCGCKVLEMAQSDWNGGYLVVINVCSCIRGQFFSRLAGGYSHNVVHVLLVPVMSQL